MHRQKNFKNKSKQKDKFLCQRRTAWQTCWQFTLRWLLRIFNIEVIANNLPPPKNMFFPFLFFS